MNEAIRISIQFFEEVKRFKRDATGRIDAHDSYKTKIMKSIEQILNGGTKAEAMENAIREYAKQHPTPEEAYEVEEIFSYLGIDINKKETKQDPNNLIESGKFYYHPALQVAPPPPMITQLDDGSFVSSYDNEEFFLEMKERFTIEDLASYFHKVMEIKGEGFKERDSGAFKHILRSYDLDTVLYTIDEARFLAEDYNKPRPKTPFDIRDYTDEGAAVLEDRKNTCYMEGLDRVIPRRR